MILKGIGLIIVTIGLIIVASLGRFSTVEAFYSDEMLPTPTATPTATLLPPPLTLTSSSPDSWHWWCNDNGDCVLLPEGQPGSQERFLLLLATDNTRLDTQYLPGWMGGGLITWEGEIVILRQTSQWTARLVEGQGRKGLVALNNSTQQAFGIVSPEAMWSQDTSVYNRVLKGDL